MPNQDLPIIQKTYDFLKWYVPILNRLPRDYRFSIGDRIIKELYDVLENLIQVQYKTHKLPDLESINIKLELLRYQTRLLLDFNVLENDRYDDVIQNINSIGIDLGNWIKQQQHLMAELN